MRGCRSFMSVCLAPFENALRCCFLFRTFMCTTEWNSVMLRNHVTHDICMGSCSLTLKISFLFFPPLSVPHLLPSPMTLCPRQQISPLFDTIVFPLLPFYIKGAIGCVVLCAWLCHLGYSFLDLTILCMIEAHAADSPILQSDNARTVPSSLWLTSFFLFKLKSLWLWSPKSTLECTADQLALSQCRGSRLALGHLSSYIVNWSPREGMASESHTLGTAYC